MAPGAARAALILALLLIGAASPEPAPAPAAPAPAAAPAAAPGRYLGKDLGALSQLHHAVRGRVFAVDARTIYLKDFHYDGEGPAAYFYVGTGKAPSAAGTRLRDERGAAGPLRRYRGESFTLSLPEGKTLKDFRTFYVWCDDFAVNFGDVSIPRELEYPRPARLGALRGVHGVSSDAVVVVDAQTLLVANFSYDGEAPDAKFWVGRGSSPSPQGLRIPDESGRDGPLRKYDRKTIVLTLPGELTVFDIGHFGVWCEAFTVDFGHVQLPARQVANVPPSLKMLGVSPQSKLNCEVLLDELAFEVRWAVAGDSVVLQLVAKLEDGDYMSFGISGDDKHSQMVGADVAVAWVDKQTLKGYSEDYYLDAKSQCAGSRGACPDEKFASNTNSLRVLNAALVNGYSIVTYQRSARAADAFDRPVLLNASQPVVWALGPLNQRLETSYHHHYNKMDKFIEFGRPPVWNCPMPEAEEDHHESAPASTSAPAAASASSSTSAPARHTNTSSALKSRPVPPPAPAPRVTPWEIPGVQCYEPADGVFYAQMGPTGGRQGYPAITGHVGWGISWYINGLLIPELTLVRGKRYTFVVEGGADPAVPARYHPFYITNDPVGGYYHRSDEEKQGVGIYAGVRRTRTGELVPTGVGRLCNWTPDPEGPGADEYPSFGAYQRSLTLVCEEGNPGVVTWTPDKNTPDTVYYQCFTHRHLGWKIHIVDECEESEAAESRLTETFALPEDLQQEESIQVVNRARPEHNFLDHRMKVEKIINTKINYNDFSSDSRGDGGLSGDVMYRVEPLRNQPLRQEYELPVSKLQIKQVIDAVESLESQMQDDLRNNITHMPIRQYQVHEDVKEFFLPEQPFREEDEYIVDSGTMPNKHLFPPNQKPLTLQTVLRPNGPNRQKENIRPPFRRPVPPEIKLRRPQPMHQGPNMYQKVSNIYPLPMPNPHGPHLMQKKPLYKHNPNNNRLPPNMNRPPQMNGAPPLKLMPHMQMHPKPGFIVPQMKQQIMPNIQNGPSPTIILGKPINLPHPSQSQTLNLGQADLIVNQIVKSQITLPGSNDAIAQFSAPQTYFNKPGQIILGKPMENPVPLDQQIIQTKYQAMQSPSTDPPETYASTSLRPQTDDSEHSPDNDMKSSDFIGESVDPPNFQPAVNTGFKPDSIVIESGFKPIIREPLMAGEDKIADYSGSNSNRRQDSDVEEDYEEALQPISNSVNKISSDRLTETFEPMFIPSPPDHILPSNDRTKEVFPSNHAKEDRPHPIYVKTESELNALFAKKNNDKQYSSDAAMESDKVSSHYLPPDPKLPEEHSQNISDENTFTTFDGKTVSASTLTNVSDVKKITKLFSSKLPAGSDVLLRTPQFGPFKGETLPSLNEENKYEVKENDTDANTTLQPVTISHKLQNNTKDLKGDDSEVHEATEKNEATKTESEEEGEYDDEEVEQEPDEKRHRRSIT